MDELWEILVPTHDKNGKRIKLSFHREWDRAVSKWTGGVTIYSPVKGAWMGRQELLHEGMIPVRVACSRKNMTKVGEITMAHYEQEEVIAYRVSSEVMRFSSDA